MKTVSRGRRTFSYLCDPCDWLHGGMNTEFYYCCYYYNERSKRTSGPVTTGIGDRLRVGIPSRAVTSQLGQLSLASLRGRLIEYQLRLG